MVIRSALKILKGTSPLELPNAVSDVVRAQIFMRTNDRGAVESSISDKGMYPAFCLLAANNQRVFSRFRRSLIYRVILEHVNYEQGFDYLREVERQGSLLDDLKTVVESDVVGGPIRYQYGRYGLVSPSTLRYIKVASDLQAFFGSLDDMEVAEIGVGYGGQCRIISSAWSVKSYDLYDIPEALKLSQRFLSESHIEAATIFDKNGREPLDGQFDLVISNYAFSELRREIQEQYLTNVVEKSARGYMTYNRLTPPDFNSLLADEVVERIAGARLVPEVPLTHDGNVIVVWGES